MTSSTDRKIKELKGFAEAADKEGNVIKSPFYNDVNKNPCIKEQNLSARCALENNADREKCADHMENYRLCHRFWEMVKSRRRMMGETPLPPPEEREAVKKVYIDEYRRIVNEIMRLENRPRTFR